MPRRNPRTISELLAGEGSLHPALCGSDFLLPSCALHLTRMGAAVQATGLLVISPARGWRGAGFCHLSVQRGACCNLSAWRGKGCFFLMRTQAPGAGHSPA